MESTDRLAAALADRYRLERQIGQGGMATVYLAHDLRHDREVALKVLRPDVTAVLGTDRFLQEIRITARLDHPHILTLIDSGTSDGFLWYVVPYIRGESLRQTLQREGQLGIPEALALTRQVAGALEYAHRQGVVHRDIKPENILLHEGEAVLADFGIALALQHAGGQRLTETGLSLGTPQYMSPEQATGDRQVDARSDVYSLAAVLYEMLAGEPPHTGPTVQAVIAKLMTERPTRLRTVRDTVPPPVDEAVARALAKVPADRYGSPAAFVAALEAAPAEEPARGTKRAVLLGASVVLAAGLVAAALLLHRPVAAQPVSYQPVQITTSGHAEQPVLSPDGSQIAYSDRLCDAGGRCRVNIVLRELGSDIERVVFRGADFAFPLNWSANGRWLLFIAARADSAGKHTGVYVASRLGGAPKYLGLVEANFVGAGDTLAVVENLRDFYSGGSRLRLRLMPVQSGFGFDSLSLPVPTSQRLLHFGDISGSPDGRWLALTWGGGVLTLYDRTGHLRDSVRVAGGLGPLRWGPGSRALFYALPTRTSNGSALVRVSFDPDRGRLGRMDTIPIGVSKSRMGPFPFSFSLTADGHTLAFGSLGSATFDLWTVEQRNGALVPKQRLRQSSVRFNAYISWSGKDVYYEEPDPDRSTGRAAMYRMPFDSGPAQLVTPASDSEYRLALSVDDQRLFMARRKARGMEITVRDLDSGKSAFVADIPDTMVDILPAAGGDVGVFKFQSNTLDILTPKGKLVRQLALPDSLQVTGRPVISWDGTAYALIGSSRTAPDGSWQVPVYRLDARTGELRLVAQMPALGSNVVVWNRRGLEAELALPAAPEWELYRVPMDGSPIEREATLPFGNMANCDLSQDAQRMVCVVRHPVSDLYLIRGFDPGRR